MLNRALLRTPWLRPAIFSAAPSSISAAASSAPRFPALYATIRPLTSIPSRQSEHPPTTPATPPSETAELPSQDAEPATTTTATATTTTPTPEPTSHIPWYLQDEPDQAATRPITAGEPIPALPENPPALLAALLEYTYKDLGLDGLNLLDLRGLDTPPALGANVIMIVGTARSVKHLNVSADRLCRWLRATYKLAPVADGLLGRNELKIKLRRKAKRARLASKSGTLVDDKDDGITTGWICVNAGIVEEAPPALEVAAAEEAGFEGFGNAGWGTRVVVQIFTEEKRAEVDLEGLWEKNLARVERQRERERAQRDDDGEEWL